MTARRIDGQELSKQIRLEIAENVRRFRESSGRTPGLTAVLIGDNPASQVYVRNKHKACEEVGIAGALIHKPASITQLELLQLIHELNHDANVSGILVQLPLPRHINEKAILLAIAPEKDVDAFHPYNVGLLATGHPRFLPCTPYGVQQMLVRSGIATSGKNVVILGRSNIVGKPLALILMQKPGPDFPQGGDATVTVVHRGTANLAETCRAADILIAAIGVPFFVTPEYVRPGGTVIDVGINSLNGKIVGDVHPDVAEVAGALSPVPKGVGPMTITMLLQNTLHAAQLMK